MPHLIRAISISAYSFEVLVCISYWSLMTSLALKNSLLALGTNFWNLRCTAGLSCISAITFWRSGSLLFYCCSFGCVLPFAENFIYWSTVQLILRKLHAFILNDLVIERCLMIWWLEPIKEKAWICALHVINKLRPIHWSYALWIFGWSCHISLDDGAWLATRFIAKLSHVSFVILWCQILTSPWTSSSQLSKMCILWHWL